MIETSNNISAVITQLKSLIARAGDAQAKAREISLHSWRSPKALWPDFGEE